MARKKTSISGQKTRIYSRFLHTVKTSLLRSAPSLADDFAPNVRPQTEIKLHFRAPSPSCKISLLKVPSVSFLGKVLDLNKNLILLGKWPRSSSAVRRALFACFCCCCCCCCFLSNCRLATSNREVK